MMMNNNSLDKDAVTGGGGGGGGGVTSTERKHEHDKLLEIFEREKFAAEVGGGGLRNLQDNNNNTDNATKETSIQTTTPTTTQTQSTQQIIPNNIDAFLANELNSLSFQQRELNNEEIHGLNVDQIYFQKVKEIEETPELLKESFTQLELELQQLQVNSFAYTRCQQLYGCNNNTNTNDNDTPTTNISSSSSSTSSSTYINTHEFRIIFLRCELFHPQKSAHRLISFVELMYDLYGDIGLQRRIRLDDLTREEIQVIQAGYIQILPGRDRAGRRIMIHIASNQSVQTHTVKSRLRNVFYAQMSLVDDIETQRKGAVFITYYHNINIFHDRATRGKVHALSINCLPVRVGAIHICIPDNEHEATSLPRQPQSTSTATTTTPVNIIKSMVALSIGPELRSKLRIHTGSAMECLYALQSFGIPSDQIPLLVGTTAHTTTATSPRTKKRRKRTSNMYYATMGDDNNTNTNHNLKLQNHIKWLKLCQLKDKNMKLYGRKWKNQHQQQPQQTIIECPNHADILSGRGNIIMKHPGNTVFRSIVMSKLSQYMNLNSYQLATKLTWEVVHLLKNQYGARFLKEETVESNGLNLGCWIEVSNEEARLKVRYAFRDKMKVHHQYQPQSRQRQPQPQPQLLEHYHSQQVRHHSQQQRLQVQLTHYSQQQLQQQLRQTQMLTMHPPTTFSSSSLSSPSPTTTSLIVERQKNKTTTTNNTNSFHHHHSHHKIEQQQQQQREEEDPDSSTSMFLRMTGIGSGGGDCIRCVSDSTPSSTGMMGTKRHTSGFDYLDCSPT